MLFCDEVHAAVDPKLKSEIGEMLKSVFDTGPDGLPYCIAATTAEEYEKILPPMQALRGVFNRSRSRR